MTFQCRMVFVKYSQVECRTMPPAVRLTPCEELQLRAWARRHYCPRDDRIASWHPIVLSEMQQVDIERCWWRHVTKRWRSGLGRVFGAISSVITRFMTFEQQPSPPVIPTADLPAPHYRRRLLVWNNRGLDSDVKAQPMARRSG